MSHRIEGPFLTQHYAFNMAFKLEADHAAWFRFTSLASQYSLTPEELEELRGLYRRTGGRVPELERFFERHPPKPEKE